MRRSLTLVLLATALTSAAASAQRVPTAEEHAGLLRAIDRAPSDFADSFDAMLASFEQAQAAYDSAFDSARIAQAEWKREHPDRDSWLSEGLSFGRIDATVAFRRAARDAFTRYASIVDADLDDAHRRAWALAVARWRRATLIDDVNQRSAWKVVDLDETCREAGIDLGAAAPIMDDHVLAVDALLVEWDLDNDRLFAAQSAGDRESLLSISREQNRIAIDILERDYEATARIAAHLDEEDAARLRRLASSDALPFLYGRSPVYEVIREMTALVPERRDELDDLLMAFTTREETIRREALAELRRQAHMSDRERERWTALRSAILREDRDLDELWEQQPLVWILDDLRRLSFDTIMAADALLAPEQRARLAESTRLLVEWSRTAADGAREARARSRDAAAARGNQVP